MGQWDSGLNGNAYRGGGDPGAGMSGKACEIQYVWEDLRETGVHGKHEVYLRRWKIGSIRVEIHCAWSDADGDTESVVDGHWFPL